MNLWELIFRRQEEDKKKGILPLTDETVEEPITDPSKARSTFVKRQDKEQDPSFGVNVKEAIKSGFGILQNQLLYLAKLPAEIQEETEKLVEKTFFPDMKKNLELIKEKYGKDPTDPFILPLLRKVLEGSEKAQQIAHEKWMKGTEKKPVQRFVGTMFEAGIPPVGALVMGAGMTPVGKIATAKMGGEKVAEAYNLLRRMAPFGTTAGASKMRELEKEDPDIPMLKKLTVGALTGAAEVGTEFLAFRTFTRIFTKPGKTLINEGIKGATPKVLQWLIGAAEQIGQEMVMEPISSSILQAVGLEPDWKTLPQRVKSAAYGGAAMTAFFFGLGGLSAGASKIVQENAVENNKTISEVIENIRNVQNIQREEGIVTLAYEDSLDNILDNIDEQLPLEEEKPAIKVDYGKQLLSVEDEIAELKESLKTTDLEAKERTKLRAELKKLTFVEETYKKEFEEKAIEAAKPKVLSVEETSKEITALHNTKGGSTFNRFKGNLVGKPGFSVAVFPEASKVIEGKEITSEQMDAFQKENEDLLKDPNNSAGTWYNAEDNKTYLDIVKVVTNEREAITLAKVNEQEAIYDLMKEEVISTADYRMDIDVTAAGEGEETVGTPEFEAATGYLTTVEGTGETVKRGLPATMEERAVLGKVIAEKWEDIPEYERVEKTEQIRMASNLLKTNPNKAYKVAMGLEPAPRGIIPEFVLKVVEEKALKDGDSATIHELATGSRLMEEATTMGQRIWALRELDDLSPVGAVRDIMKAKEKAYTRRKGDIKKAKAKDKKQIKANIKKESLIKTIWQKFIKLIRC